MPRPGSPQHRLPPRARLRRATDAHSDNAEGSGGRPPEPSPFQHILFQHIVFQAISDDGRRFMNAARRQVATVSPRWLNAWCSNSTTPAVGRERDDRSERTMVRAWIVSPWNTGLGNSTLLIPRLAIVVP